MRILILQTVGGFVPGGDLAGGSLQVLGLAEEWSAQGHEVDFVTNASDEGEDRYRGAFRVHRIPSLGLQLAPSPLHILLEMLFNHLRQWRALRLLAARMVARPTVVLAASPYPSDVLATFRLTRLLRVPGAVYFHHMSPRPWWFPRRRGGALRVLANWLMWLSALTLSKIGGLLPVLYNPTEMDRTGWRFPEVMPGPAFLIAAGNPPPRINPPTYAACFIGRVTPNKGVLDLLEAWGDVVRRWPEAKLVVAGRCFYEGFEVSIADTIRRSGLQDNVERRGFISSEEKGDLLARTLLFPFPSYEEGWSLGVMEAAHHGVLPVVYDLPAYDYLDCEDIRVPVGNIPAFADRLAEFLGEPERVADLTSLLRSKVAKYTREEVARRHAEYLERYISPRGLATPPTLATEIRGHG